MSFYEKSDYTIKVQLITFGELKLSGSSFNRHKPMLLLCFLALEGARPRRYLAELFYGHAKNPLNSLSRALSHLRGVEKSILAADDVNIATTIACDAKMLERHLDKNELEAGINLYKAPFLQAITLDLNSELEEWVLVTREHLAGRVREAHLRLGERLAAQGDFDDAARHAEAAYKLPGANELEPEDFARTYTLLSAGGSPQAPDIRKEAASFGIRLFLNSDDARAQLFTGQTAPLPVHNLPRRRTSFVGRNAELEKVAEVFADARYRLLTLLGPGGIGKSRLAVEAAYRQLRLERFKDGTNFVELDPVTIPELVPVAIAEALGLELRGADDPLRQITKHIGDSAKLLILDNFEHLIAGAAIIHDLLDSCRHLSILITSRERLNLADEWVLELSGLGLGEEGGPGSEALQLFVQRAKRARLGFSLTHEELPHAQTICNLVGGFPLGIELAAAWIKLLSPADIAAEIKQGLGFLESPTRNVTERQRSINAAFEYSWNLLNPNEQSVMRKLSVFNGGFRKEAAAQVADASLPVLASLVDKSLLLVKGDSRYERHALLFQFAQEKLAKLPEEEAEVKAKHAHYFHAYLKYAEADLRGPRTKEAMDTIEQEFENIRLAWAWAIEQADADTLRQSAVPLRRFFTFKGRYAEGVRLFETAITSLSHSEDAHSLGALLIEQACLLYSLGDYAAAKTLAERGLKLVPTQSSAKTLLEGHLVLGALRFYEGDYRAAKKHWLEVVALGEAGSAEGLTRALNYLGIVSAQLHETAEAERYYRQSLALCRKLGDNASLVSTLNNYATFQLNSGNLEPAKHALEEGLAIAEDIELRNVTPYLMNNLARINCELELFEEANILAKRALQLARDMAEPMLEAKIHLESLAKVAAATGQTRQAYEHFARALSLAREMSATPIMLEAIAGIIALSLKQSYSAELGKLYYFVVRHPALPDTLETVIMMIKSELTELLPDLDHQRALQEADSLQMPEAVELALQKTAEYAQS